MAKLYQLTLDQSLVDCGMSYVIELASGHFVMVDGGYFTPGEADRLYRFLSARCGGKPVILNWFFSHAHQDHIGVFLDMMDQHRADVDVRRLSYHFQPLALPETSEGWRETSNDLATAKRFYEVVEDSGIPVMTLHTGDAWQEEELTLEVLYTHENREHESTFNDCSVVLKATCGQDSVLFLGDIWEEGSRYLLQHQRARLACRYVQVAHHGFNGGSIELYRAIPAETALWSIADYRMESIRRQEVNRYLLEQSSIRKHLFNFDGVACLPLGEAEEGE